MSKIHPAFAIIHFSSLFRHFKQSKKVVTKNEIIVLFIHVGHDFLNLMAFHLLKEQFRRFFFWCFYHPQKQ